MQPRADDTHSCPPGPIPVAVVEVGFARDQPLRDETIAQVYMILDEFFLAGEVQETSKQAILHRVQELDKLD